MTFLKYNSCSTKFILLKHAVQWLIIALIGEQLLYQAVFVPAAVVGLCRSSREQRNLRQPGAAELPRARFLLPTSCCSERGIPSSWTRKNSQPWWWASASPCEGWRCWKSGRLPGGVWGGWHLGGLEVGRRAGECWFGMLGGGWVRSNGWRCPSSPNTMQTGADALFPRIKTPRIKASPSFSVLTNKLTFNEPLKALGSKSGAQTASISD